MSNNKPDLFFSYRSTYVKKIRRLAEALKGEGINVWMDEYGISHKEQAQFEQKINDAIDSSKFMVVFVSEDFMESKYCIDEVYRMIRVKKHTHYLVFLLSENALFEKKYPELYTIKIEFNEDEIINWLKARKFIPEKLILPKFKPSGGQAFCRIQEAGFYFNCGDYWQGVYKGLFEAMDRGKHFLEFKKEPRREFPVLEAKINGRNILLFLDYELYDDKNAEDIGRKIIKEEPDLLIEDKDRERLKAEIGIFPQEVLLALNMVEKFHEKKWDLLPKNLSFRYQNEASSSFKSFLNKWEYIGIHLFTTRYRNKSFRHRLFSFCIPEKYIFRVYKLVLPHPQFTTHDNLVPISIRFIFCWEDEPKYFFRTISYCDEVVESFAWNSDLTNEEILSKLLE